MPKFLSFIALGILYVKRVKVSEKSAQINGYVVSVGTNIQQICFEDMF